MYNYSTRPRWIDQCCWQWGITTTKTYFFNVTC